MDIFDDLFYWWINGFPRMGEIKRYKVVPMTDEDIAKETIAGTEAEIKRYKDRVAELEAELQKQKKRLKP